MNQRFTITPANAATDQRITDSVHRTLTVIGIFGDKNGWCWPSQKTIAELRGVSRQTINTHIKELISLGYLNIAPRYDDETGAQKSNMMQIKFDYAPDLTGGVKSKTLQGVSSLELYTPHQAQDLTHNAPSNDPVNDLSNSNDDPLETLVTLFAEKTFCRIPTNGRLATDWLDPLVAIYKASGEDYETTVKRLETAVNILKEKGYPIVSPASIQNTAVNLPINPPPKKREPQTVKVNIGGQIVERTI